MLYKHHSGCSKEEGTEVLRGKGSAPVEERISIANFGDCGLHQLYLTTKKINEWCREKLSSNKT
jgi:hypothetical protein